MNQTETKKFGEFGALNNLVIFFRMIANPPLKCRKDWSLKIFGKMGALDSERWEYPAKFCPTSDGSACIVKNAKF